MKKLVSLIAAASMMFSTASAEATKRIDAFEYQGLFAKRSEQAITKYGINYQTMVGSGFFYDDGNAYVFMLSSGDAVVNKDDFTIEELTMTYYDANASDVVNDRHRYSCIFAMSALECSEIEESILQHGATFGNDSTLSPMDKAGNTLEKIRYDIFQVMFSDDAKEILVYSGNYDYYAVRYKKDGAEACDYIFIIAREK